MRILIAGTGHVATRMALALRKGGVIPAGIWGRNESAARELATRTGSAHCVDWQHAPLDVDLVVLAVADDAIATVAQEVASVLDSIEQAPLVVHTSGGTPLTVLAERGLRRYGVAWPLQSLRKEKDISFSEVPICIEASDEAGSNLLHAFGKLLGSPTYPSTDEQRAVLHLAAVFTNNFVNHLLAIAHGLLQDADLPFEMLMPLLRQTIQRLDTAEPASLQTGPAIRGDMGTMDRHLRLLEQQPRWQALYRLLSESIAELHRRPNS